MKYPRWLPYPGAVVNTVALAGGLILIGFLAALAFRPIQWLWSLQTIASGLIAIWWGVLTLAVMPVFLLAKLHQSVWWSWRRLSKDPMPYKFNPPRRSWFEGVFGIGIALLSGLAVAFWIEVFGFTSATDNVLTVLWLVLVSYVYHLRLLQEEERKAFRQKYAASQSKSKSKSKSKQQRQKPAAQTPKPSSVDEELEELKRKLRDRGK